jgi:hypothetical protein
MTPAGIDTATSRFVAQYLNQLRHQQRAPVLYVQLKIQLCRGMVELRTAAGLTNSYIINFHINGVYSTFMLIFEKVTWESC